MEATVRLHIVLWSSNFEILRSKTERARWSSTLSLMAYAEQAWHTVSPLAVCFLTSLLKIALVKTTKTWLAEWRHTWPNSTYLNCWAISTHTALTIPYHIADLAYPSCVLRAISFFTKSWGTIVALRTDALSRAGISFWYLNVLRKMSIWII